MQQRLTRSTKDVIIAGVCGGLGEYFNIDPIIARLIFVVVTLTSGFGIPVYLILWLLMPKGQKVAATLVPDPQTPLPHQHTPPIAGGAPDATRIDQGKTGQPATQQPVSPPQTSAYQAPPTPDAYRFDPQTGQPIAPATPATGETIKLDFDTTSHASMHYPPSDVTYHTTTTGQLHQRNQNWRKLSMVLMGVGGLVLLNQFGISMGIIIPPIMIIAGIILLKRSR